MSAIEWLNPAVTKNITGAHAPSIRPVTSLADKLTSTATVTRILHSTPMKNALPKGIFIFPSASCTR